MTDRENFTKNRLRSEDAAIHRWYRFVLAYPPHLVREYLGILEADPTADWVFDPFCGTATTAIEARLQGFSTISVDANPIGVLAARVKLGWDINLNEIQEKRISVLALASAALQKVDLPSSSTLNGQLPLFDTYRPSTKIDGFEEFIKIGFPFDNKVISKLLQLIPEGFISHKPLMRVLALKYAIDKLAQDTIRDFLYLALANTIITTAGNVAFGPEVYRTAPHEDADVLGGFEATLTSMIHDLNTLPLTQSLLFPPAHIFEDDARTLDCLKDRPPIGIVITSPPYPNEKDYTRSTRLESVLLDFIMSTADLRNVKSKLLRSNTRNVFSSDRDDTFIQDIPSIVDLANRIEERRLELGKTSGFERLYHRVTRLYFGGMYRHLATLFTKLRPGGRCAYVVGDQMSYFRIHIPTAKLLADVAIKAGYKVEGINLWRTRRSTTTGQDLDENVLILKRP